MGEKRTGKAVKRKFVKGGKKGPPPYDRRGPVRCVRRLEKVKGAANSVTLSSGKSSGGMQCEGKGDKKNGGTVPLGVLSPCFCVP